MIDRLPDERFTRMMQFMKSHQEGLSQEEAESQTLAYMATMPVWRDHPKVAGRA